MRYSKPQSLSQFGQDVADDVTQFEHGSPDSKRPVLSEVIPESLHDNLMKLHIHIIHRADSFDEFRGEMCTKTIGCHITPFIELRLHQILEGK